MTYPSQSSKQALFVLITLVLQAPPYQTLLVAMPERKDALKNLILPFKYSNSLDLFIGQIETWPHPTTREVGGTIC